MNLPKLESITYTLTIPSTGKEVEFRPFLVKEEKILMQAQESDDTDAILRAVKNIISACFFEKVDPEKLAIYDIEYLFLQLRAKSVGETASIITTCAACGKELNTDINIAKLKLQDPEVATESKIQLNDSVGIILRAPQVRHMKLLESEDLIENVSVLIDKIYDADSVYETDDADPKELETFIGSLTHANLEKILQFAYNQPKISKTIKYKCSCGHDNETVLEGFQNFFG